MAISKAGMKALKRAAKRKRGNLCPVVGVHAAAETALLESLERRGLIYLDGIVPRISDAGRIAVTHLPTHEESI